MSRVAFLVAALLALNIAADVLAQPQAVKLPDTITEVVVSSTTGATATIEKDKLVIYPKLSSRGNTDGEMTVPLTGKAVAIAHKPTSKGGLFIAADDQRNIYVVNDPSGEVLGTIKVDVDVVDVAAPQNPELNVAFYVAKEPNPVQLVRLVGRIDVSAMKDRGMLDLAGNFSGDEYALEAAPDGRTLYLARPRTSPTGIHSLQIEAGSETRLVSIHNEHQTIRHYIPLASGLGTVVNKELRSVDLETKIRDLPGIALCSMSSRPVVFCEMEDEGKIVAASLNTGEQLAALGVTTREPAAKQPGAPRPNPLEDPRPGALRPLKRWIFVDETNQKLLIFPGGAALVFPLDSLRLPNEPLIAVRLEGSTDLFANQPWSAKLVGFDKSVKISPREMPPGMKLNGDTLSWTPGSNSVGPAQIKLNLSSNGLKSEQQLDLVVRRPSIQLPFQVASYAITPDGKRLVAIGTIIRDPRQDPNRSSHVAAVDLGDGRVLFVKELEFRASAVEASNDMVFLAAQSADALYWLNIDKPQEVSKIFTDATVSGLAVAGQRLYVSLNRRVGTRNGLVVYALPKLEPMSGLISREFSIPGMQSTALPIDVGNGWRLSEGVWSRDFEKMLLLLDAPGIPSIHLRGGEDPFPLARWGTVVQGGQVRRVSGQVIDQRNGSPDDGTLLVDFPAAVFLNISEHARRGEASMTSAELIGVDLIEGKEERLTVMYEKYVPNRVASEFRYARRGQVTSLPGQIIAIVSDRIFVVPSKLLKTERYAEPLYFEPQQSLIMVSGSETSKITYKLRGGMMGFRYSLIQQAPGLDINPKTGEVFVDAQKLISGQQIGNIIDQLTGMAATAANRSGISEPRPQPSTALQLAAEPIAVAERLLGKKPTGIPVLLRIGVRVRDSNQQEAVLEHSLVIDTPPDLFQKASDERTAQMQARTQQRQQSDQQRRQASAQRVAATTNPADVAALSRRVQELELENARLKAQLDLLKELHQGGPTTRPSR